MTAGAFVALVGYDFLVQPTHLAPVGDLAGIDGPDLIGGQGVDGVVLMYKENECFMSDGRIDKLRTVFPGIGDLGFGGVSAEENICVFLGQVFVSLDCVAVIEEVEPRQGIQVFFVVASAKTGEPVYFNK